MDKKGLELAWSTIVIMVLALAVLIFLLVFFLNSSESFSDNIKSYFTYSNADSIVQGCNVFVDSRQEYSYCCEKKDLKYYDDGEKVSRRFTCNDIYEGDIVEGLKSLECGVGC